jgi:hypothetical protein
MQRTHRNLTDQHLEWIGETPVVDEARTWLARRLVWERRLATLERAC